MGLNYIEHFLILTHDPDATRDWWVENLGFRSDEHPEFGFPVHWLYIGDQDVVHIGKANHSAHQNEYLRPGDEIAATTAEANPGSGRIDHICFNCSGIDDFVNRLQTSGIKFNERQAHDQSLYQLFFTEPINRIKIELNFPAEEAAKSGRTATLTAADAAQ